MAALWLLYHTNDHAGCLFFQGSIYLVSLCFAGFSCHVCLKPLNSLPGRLLAPTSKAPYSVRLYHHEGITLSRKTSRVTKKSLNANMYVIGRPDIHETPQNSIDHIWPIHFTNLALLCYFIRPYTAHTFHKSSSLMLFYYDPNLFKSLLVLTERARPRREAGPKRSGSLPI